MIWDYQRNLREGGRRDKNRNIAIYGNLIIDTSMDNSVGVALPEDGAIRIGEGSPDGLQRAKLESGQ